MCLTNNQSHNHHPSSSKSERKFYLVMFFVHSIRGFIYLVGQQISSLAALQTPHNSFIASTEVTYGKAHIICNLHSMEDSEHKKSCQVVILSKVGGHFTLWHLQRHAKCCGTWKILPYLVFAVRNKQSCSEICVWKYFTMGLSWG